MRTATFRTPSTLSEDNTFGYCLADTLNAIEVSDLDLIEIEIDVPVGYVLLGGHSER